MRLAILHLVDGQPVAVNVDRIESFMRSPRGETYITMAGHRGDDYFVVKESPQEVVKACGNDLKFE